MCDRTSSLLRGPVHLNLWGNQCFRQRIFNQYEFVHFNWDDFLSSKSEVSQSKIFFCCFGGGVINLITAGYT